MSKRVGDKTRQWSDLGGGIIIDLIFSPVRVTALMFHIVTISNWDQIKESSPNWAIHPEQSKIGTATWEEVRKHPINCNKYARKCVYCHEFRKHPINSNKYARKCVYCHKQKDLADANKERRRWCSLATLSSSSACLSSASGFKKTETIPKSITKSVQHVVIGIQIIK